ncbi:MAG: hypothetical protein HKN12_03370 [Gemmatimonadetes bacterium]|nr:hypothetical protein [Gemmatimonadota bacterium]
MRHLNFPIVLMLALVLAVVAAAPAFAIDNTATGDIKGVSGDLTDSNTFTINASTLALTKTAWLTDGTQLTSGTSVPSGTQVHFMIYVDNTTAVPVTNVNLSDPLAAGFTYTANSIRVDNTVATGATEAAIYAAVSTATVLDDGTDATDVAGIAGTTISAGSTTSNTQLDIAGSAVWAILFEVTVN